MKLKHQYSGKSLLELLEEFGLGEKGFYSNWFKNEAFANDKAPAGLYEIDFENKLANLNYKEQKEKLPKGYDFPNPAVLAEAILTHYKNTGERLMGDWCSMTLSIVSDDDRVYVGRFDSDGLGVHGDWGGCRYYDDVGVSAVRKLKGLGSRKLDSSLEPQPIELEITELTLKINGKDYKFIKK